MRVLIDLQGGQGSNKSRGIGRYSVSIAQAIARIRGNHEVFIALNTMLPEIIPDIRNLFRDILPPENVVSWGACTPASHAQGAGSWEKTTAELIRAAFLYSLDPDIIFITSLYEGLGDDAVTTVENIENGCPTAVILYDLIPHIRGEHYLSDPTMAAWYSDKFKQMRKADLLLAISESSRQEGIHHLGFSEEKVVNIGTAADDHFVMTPIDLSTKYEIQQCYGLTRPFVMYTGGIDHRKNIEGMIRGYALLPLELRKRHQLAVVCVVSDVERNNLSQLALSVGLKADELVLTGYVSEKHLVALYNMCTAFVFPSFHEGFGLPVLEAMHCGAPVLASNATSLPEVLGYDEALFNPYDAQDIALHMVRVLTDEKFRRDLIGHGLKQAQTFSWNTCARKAWEGFELIHAEHGKKVFATTDVRTRKKMAYVSPVPPDKSGIADYSFELLPALKKKYDIEIILPEVSESYGEMAQDWTLRDLKYFQANNLSYDRVLYHVGNSTFHQHMLDALEWAPGVVVLHDFFISNLICFLECSGLRSNLWVQSLYTSHGYGALVEYLATADKLEIVRKYPCNKSIVDNSLGVIVHSEHSRSLGVDWLDPDVAKKWQVIPLCRVPAPAPNRAAAKQALGYSPDDFLVCSFGILSPTKRNLELLYAWNDSTLKHDANSLLIFVGQIGDNALAAELRKVVKIHGLSDRVKITGWVDSETYQKYLSAADVAVQLRALSRGETSAAVLDCMNYGVSTIVNAHGAMAELPADAVLKMDDHFSQADLVAALNSLRHDDVLRKGLENRGREFVHSVHAPERCAQQYVEAIEGFYAQACFSPAGQVLALMKIPEVRDSEAIQRQLAQVIADNHPIQRRQLLLDISMIVGQDASSANWRGNEGILQFLLSNAPAGWRVEPVFATATSCGYRYARRVTLRTLGGNPDVLVDDPIEVCAGDIFLGLESRCEVLIAQKHWLRKYHAQGVDIHFVVYDFLDSTMFVPHSPSDTEGLVQFIKTIAAFDGAVCFHPELTSKLGQLLAEIVPERTKVFHIECLHEPVGQGNSHQTVQALSRWIERKVHRD